MRISGEAAVQATPDRVWAVLHDPAALARAVPGCQQLEVTGRGTCRLTVTASVASTTGTYTGEAKLTGPGPQSFTVTAALAGAPGTITATVHAKLTSGEDGSARLTYAADATPQGLIANLGTRLLTSTAARLATQFADALASDTPPPPPAVPAPGRSPAGAAGVASPAGPAAQGASGTTTKPPAAPCQPAGRLAAAPAPRFAQGVLAGAALTLAAVVLASRARRRNPR